MENTKTLKECLTLLTISHEELEKLTLQSQFSLIKEKYYDLIRQTHPDKNPTLDGSRFREVRACFNVLKKKYSENNKESKDFTFAIFFYNGAVAEDFEGYLNGNVPSWDFYEAAEAVEMPRYCVEPAKSGRSKCNKCKETIEKGDIRIGGLMEGYGTYSRWNHLNCWRIPERIWSALSDENNADTVLSELLEMDELVLKGFSVLNHSDQQDIVACIRDSTKWASYSKKKQKDREARLNSEREAMEADDSKPAAVYEPDDNDDDRKHAAKQDMWNNDNPIEQSKKAGENEEDIIDTSNTAKLDSNLQHMFCVDFKELIEGYKNDEGEYIDMSRPRDASYTTETGEYNEFSYNFEIIETTRLGKNINLISAAKHQANIKNESFDPYGYRSMPTKVRGITLRQLRAILPLIKRRCEKEKWTRPVYKDGKETDEVEKVTPKNATLYDINAFIIKPFTEFSQKSFVQTLPSTKGTQPPRWYVCHYKGETFVHTMACLECLVKDFGANDKEEHDKRGGGMTEDTPLWICSFANNQHNLDSIIADDPADTSFAKAMKIANFRVISILDVNNQVYTRLWCMYELYLTLLLSREQGIDGVLGIYTYHEHEDDIRFDEMNTAVGLIEGAATYEDNERQSYFPLERLLPFLTVSIQNAKASRNEDRTHILNSLVGRKEADLDVEPLKHHDNYDKLNDAIRGAVFSSQATLNLIYETRNDGYWNSALSALEKSIAKEFRFLSQQMPQLTKEAVAQLFHHLPSGLEELHIILCKVAIDALLDWLENKSTNLKLLHLSHACVGGEVGGKECGERLARFLARDDCKIEEIDLSLTDLVGSRNVDTWIECLEKNQSLKKVTFRGMAHFVEGVGKSENPNTSIDIRFGYNGKHKIYWDGTTFPDATLSIEQEKTLKETASKIGGSILNCFIVVALGEESTSSTKKRVRRF